MPSYGVNVVSSEFLPGRSLVKHEGLRIGVFDVIIKQFFTLYGITFVSNKHDWLGKGIMIRLDLETYQSMLKFSQAKQ